MLTELMLARVQFAFTVSFHILFPAFTIGLASWLVVLEAFWLKTQQIIYKELYQQWVKIFALSFGMGVVSGIVLAYQIGLNWSEFSRITGNVIGPLMAFEVLTAFFLESSFLGVMLFGWNKVSPRMHFFSSVIVAFGTLISSFWILAVNSWMQTPVAYTIDGQGVMHPLSWLKIIFNPSFPYRLVHMISASYLTTAFVVAGVASYYLLKKQHIQHGLVMMKMSLFMMIVLSPLQILFGDLHGLNTLKHQPAKVAAIEGIWETEKSAALRLFALPNAQQEKNDYEIKIPYLSSLILTHSWDGEIKGLKEWAPSERPPVTPVFFAFRIMVGIGLLMLFSGVWGGYLLLKNRLSTSPCYYKFCILMSPSGFIAVLCGWMVSEIGRQPYIVYRTLKTAHALSPVPKASLIASLSALIVVYGLIFGAGIRYILGLMKKGPTMHMNPTDIFGSHGLKTVPLMSDLVAHSHKEAH